MSSSTNTFRLIILNDSREEAERLISMFHNADRPCRAKHANDGPCLNKLLEERRWDLLIVYSDIQSLSPVDVIRLIKKLNRDIPVIILASEVAPRLVIESMRQGAKDVVQLDNDQHLIQVVDRELENRRQRENSRRAKRQVKKFKRDNRELLDRSRDAIAFIEDGMYRYVNDSFAELFGYKDKDEMECMPIMDMIDADDHSDVKQALKAFTLQHNGAQEHCKLQFNAITESGDKKSLTVNLRMADFDEEPCIQFMTPTSAVVHDEGLEAELESVKYTDQATGLFNRQHMLEQLERAIDAAANSGRNQHTTLYRYR